MPAIASPLPMSGYSPYRGRPAAPRWRPLPPPSRTAAIPSRTPSCCRRSAVPPSPSSATSIGCSRRADSGWWRGRATREPRGGRAARLAADQRPRVLEDVDGKARRFGGLLQRASELHRDGGVGAQRLVSGVEPVEILCGDAGGLTVDPAAQDQLVDLESRPI